MSGIPTTEEHGWWFETTRFANVAEREDEVNPGRYGKRLASWLAKKLRARGWDVRDTFAEDWGWMIAVARGDDRLFVACGNEDGSATRWSVQVEMKVGFFRRLFGAPSTRALDDLDADLGAIIEADSKTTWRGREQPGRPPVA